VDFLCSFHTTIVHSDCTNRTNSAYLAQSTVYARSLGSAQK
jgi:hypothetical protein